GFAPISISNGNGLSLVIISSTTSLSHTSSGPVSVISIMGSTSSITVSRPGQFSPSLTVTRYSPSSSTVNTGPAQPVDHKYVVAPDTVASNVTLCPVHTCTSSPRSTATAASSMTSTKAVATLLIDPDIVVNCTSIVRTP